MENNQFHEVSNNIVLELIKENRSAKRWKNIRFFIVLLVIIVFFAFLLVPGKLMLVDLFGDKNPNYVSYIRLNGSIEAGQDFSADQVLPILKDAFSDKDSQGVLLDINSGGGTPVQASIIHDAILFYKKKYHKKVVVIGEDMLASGAYYVAVAADKIYVNPNSITGSIGVVMKGFGFTGLLQKTGIERRVYTSGENKDRLDPFLPQSKEDVSKINQIITEVHGNFNQVVLEARKGKLHASPDQLFSGDFWSGETAYKLGLVDGVGNLMDVLSHEFNASRYRDYSLAQNPLKNIFSQLGTSLSLPWNKMDRGVREEI